MKLSRRQRREISAAEFLRITVHQDTDGKFTATLTELAHPDDIDRYTSKGMPTMEEAVGLARYEWECLVEKRVDAMEAEDVATEAIESKSEWQRRTA